MNFPPTQQTEIFESFVQDKLNQFCPEKTERLSTQDKPWVTAEVKQLDRQKSRKYNKRGKTEKYKELAKKFKDKYNSEAEKFLRRNMDELTEAKPGQAYNVLTPTHSHYLTM